MRSIGIATGILTGILLASPASAQSAPSELTPGLSFLRPHFGVTFGDLQAGRPRVAPIAPKAAAAFRELVTRGAAPAVPADCRMPVLKSDPALDAHISRQPDPAVRFTMRVLPAPVCPAK